MSSQYHPSLVLVLSYGYFPRLYWSCPVVILRDCIGPVRWLFYETVLGRIEAGGTQDFSRFEVA